MIFSIFKQLSSPLTHLIVSLSLAVLLRGVETEALGVWPWREHLSVRGKHCTSQPVMPLPKRKSRSKLYLPSNCRPCSQSCIRWWLKPLRASKFSGFVLFQVPKVICGRTVAAIQAVTASCPIAVFFAFPLGERREIYTTQEVNET